MKTNKEKKQIKFNEILSKHKHLENYCTIEATGLDTEDIYFHTTFKIEDGTYIYSQSDVKSNANPDIYALRFVMDRQNHLSVEINEDLLTPMIIGYHTNKDIVALAVTTLYNIKKHIQQLDYYTSQYVNNLIVGSSINDVTQCFINELNTTSKAIEFLKQNKNN